MRHHIFWCGCTIHHVVWFVFRLTSFQVTSFHHLTLGQVPRLPSTFQLQSSSLKFQPSLGVSSSQQHRVAKRTMYQVKRTRKLGNIHKACVHTGLDAEYTFVVQVSRELSQILIDRGRSDLWPLVEKVQIRYLRARCVKQKNFINSFRKLNKHYKELDAKARFIFVVSWTHVLFNRRYCRAQVHYLGYCLISYNQAVDGPLYDGFEDLKHLLTKSLDEVLQFSRLLMNSLEMNCNMLEARPAAEVERCMAMSVEFVIHLVKSSGSVEEAGEAALWNINWAPPGAAPVAMLHEQRNKEKKILSGITNLPAANIPTNILVKNEQETIHQEQHRSRANKRRHLRLRQVTGHNERFDQSISCGKRTRKKRY